MVGEVKEPLVGSSEGRIVSLFHRHHNSGQTFIPDTENHLSPLTPQQIPFCLIFLRVRGQG